jgi:hypothetical protein
MQESQWAVKLEKSQNGKVCLNFGGRFYFSFRHLIYVLTLLITLISTFLV